MTPLLIAAALLVQAAAVEGRVLVAGSDTPVAGAEVRIDALGLATHTGDDGAFFLPRVAQGRWTVRAAAPGLEAVEVGVIVPAAGAVRVEFSLPRRTVRARLIGRVVDAATGGGIPGAEIGVVGGATSSSDGEGRFELVVARAGATRVRAWAYGYDPTDTLLEASTAAVPVEVRLRPRPFGLQPIAVRATASSRGGAAERQLFDLEPRPGVIGMARLEISEIPVMVERDVLRALQALPGVVQINDLSAQLHVRGGGPDQNLFLLDGARVFAPYHMFGMFGAFNADAVSRVQFFRGDLAARHGGALSSVVEIEQRDDLDGVVEMDAALGILSAGATARGVLPAGQGRWMVAGRKTTIGAVLAHTPLLAEGEDAFPFSFHDVQARLSFSPTPAHRLMGSLFGSDDRFRMFLLGDDGSLSSRWSNRVGSLRWLWDPGPDRSTTVVAWASRYDVDLGIGFGGETPTTRNVVDVRGVRLEAVRRGATGIRAGAELQTGAVLLRGGERPGGYVDGEYEAPYGWASAYAELEREIGPVRLAPGLRVELGEGRPDVLIAPRLAARLHLTDDLALTAGASRTHQALSTLRDDRYVIPGPPFWFAHAADAPVSTSDGVSIAMEGWTDRLWSFSFGAFGRRFRDLPVWRPAGDRTFDDLRWDHGGSAGAEAIVRRHGEGLHGWVSYGWSRTRLEGADGEEYLPVWDRSHAVDIAMFARAGRTSVSGRVVYGTGTPFWAQAGLEAAKFLAPGTGKIEERQDFPIWGEEQMRFPAYFRADVQVRYRAAWWGIDIEPYAGLLNLTARPNVLYYEYRPLDPPEGGRLEPRSPVLPPLVPSLGVDVRF